MKYKKIFIMVGIPGSGKSTWVEKHKGKKSLVLNADSIREELYGDASIQGDGKEVFKLLYSKLEEALLNKNLNEIYIDNTSVHYKARRQIYDVLEKNEDDCPYNCTVILFKNFNQAKERNQKRDRIVPDHVLERMISNFEEPGFKEIFCHNIEVKTINDQI